MPDLRRMVQWQLALTPLVGMAIGGWMFGWLGMALFLVVGVVITWIFRLVASVGYGIASALALLIAGLAFQSSATLPWGGAPVPDGTRYRVSPVGLSHVLSPDQSVPETVDCGWYLASGYVTPCLIAPGGESAFRRLLAVYPMIQGAFLLSLVGALLSFRPAKRIRIFQRLLSGAAALSTTIAMVLFAESIDDALAPLSGLPVGVGGTLGTLQLSAAVLLCLGQSVAPILVRPATIDVMPVGHLPDEPIVPSR